jgi:tight adherence protein B
MMRNLVLGGLEFHGREFCGPDPVLILLALAVFGALLSAFRSPRRSTLRTLGGPELSAPDGIIRRLGARARRRLIPASAARSSVQVRLVISQVTALLRAGAPPAAAWPRAAGIRVDSSGLPDQGELVQLVGPESAMAVIAASRLAMTVGTPLAPALGVVCEAVAAQSEADADRTAAFAGPRTTAKVLFWLPVVGLGLGVVLGADPWATATDGGVGTACVLLGLVALAAGRAWINHLVSKAAAVIVELP